MATPPMELKKGDVQTHYFQMPIESWAAGGTLWFTAKPLIDNDTTDAAAIVNKSFSDTDVVLSDHEMYDADYATYELEFLPADITNVTFDEGETRRSYIGEFVHIDASNLPQTFPVDDTFIEVIVFAVVKRGGA